MTRKPRTYWRSVAPSGKGTTKGGLRFILLFQKAGLLSGSRVITREFFQTSSRIMNKVCNRCGRSKPLDDFHKDCRQVTGHRGICKTCINPAKPSYPRPQAARWESYAAQAAAPCNGCYYQKRCAEGWSCPVYRRWERSDRYKVRPHEEKIPDARI